MINIENINFAPLQQLMVILLAFIVIDIGTGFLKALVKKCLDSTKMREGLMKKFFEVIVCVVAFLLDKMIGIDKLSQMTVVFYCIEEALSILENTAEYMPYPQVIKNLLEQLKSKK